MKKILTALSSVLIYSCFGAGLVTVPIGPGSGSGGGTAVSAGSGITMVTNGNVVTISSSGGSAAGPFTNTLTYGDKFNTNQFYVYTNMMIGSNLVFLLTNINGSSLYWNASSGLSATNLTLTGNILYSNNKQTNALYIDIGDAGVSNAVGNVHFNNGNVSASGSNWVALSQTVGQSATNLGNSWFGSVQQGEIDAIGQGFFPNVVSRGFAQVAVYAGLSVIYQTNNLYSITNAVTTAAGVSMFVLDMTKPDVTCISATNAQITGYANITNGVRQVTELELKNTSGTNWVFNVVAGTQIMGDYEAFNGTLVVTNGKSATASIVIKGGLSTNLTFKTMKN